MGIPLRFLSFYHAANGQKCPSVWTSLTAAWPSCRRIKSYWIRFCVFIIFFFFGSRYLRQLYGTTLEHPPHPSLNSFTICRTSILWHNKSVYLYLASGLAWTRLNWTGLPGRVVWTLIGPSRLRRFPSTSTLVAASRNLFLVASKWRLSQHFDALKWKSNWRGMGIDGAR